MTAIDKKNDLIVTALIKFEKLTLNEAKTIALIVVSEVLEEYEIMRIEPEMKAFYIKYWKQVKHELEKL